MNQISSIVTSSYDGHTVAFATALRAARASNKKQETSRTGSRKRLIRNRQEQLRRGRKSEESASTIGGKADRRPKYVVVAVHKRRNQPLFHKTDRLQKRNKKPTMTTMAATTNHANETTSKRRNALLNKFLTKTYHMLDQCPQDIACWSNGGASFTINDVDAFENEVLPKYFNHSKFPSFVRQLNFYGFNKERSDPDLQTHTKAVRFSHDYFKRGHPDLLHKIQRTTASKQVGGQPAGLVENLNQQVADLRAQLTAMENQIDDRVQEAFQSLEKIYLTRVQNLEKSLLATMVSQYKGGFSTAPYLPVRSLSPTVESATNLATLADYVRSSRTTTQSK
jgi:hypothetical protein